MEKEYNQKNSSSTSTLTNLQRAIKTNPLDPFAWHLLGVELYKTRNYLDALYHFKRAEEIKAGFSNANLCYLGDCLALTGDIPGAMAILEKAATQFAHNKIDKKGQKEAKRLLLKLSERVSK